MIRRTSEGEQGHSGQARHAPAWPAGTLAGDPGKWRYAHIWLLSRRRPICRQGGQGPWLRMAAGKQPRYA
jgi:hypothetical protein